MSLEPYLYQYQEKSYESAQEVASWLYPIIKPDSIIDIGCGLGTWLKAFQEQGSNTILGIDQFTLPANALISSKNYQKHDLNTPLQVDELYDFAICLEVAEHLSPHSASTLVKSLTLSSNIVLFSAAIPYQPGDGHIHLQLLSYWAKLFEEQDFKPLDVLRMPLWNNEKIDYYYKQNMILFVNKNIESQVRALFLNQTEHISLAKDLVHPFLLLKKMDEYQKKITYLEKELAYARESKGVKISWDLLLKAIFRKLPWN